MRLLFPPVRIIVRSVVILKSDARSSRWSDASAHHEPVRDAATAERLGLPFERIIVNIDRYGNTTAGTIPLATRDALSTGRLKKGDLVLFAAVGAGYTVGAALWRWAY